MLYLVLVSRRKVKQSSLVFLLPSFRRAPKKMVKMPRKQRMGPKGKLLGQMWCWVSSLGAQARSIVRKPLATSIRPITRSRVVEYSF